MTGKFTASDLEKTYLGPEFFERLAAATLNRTRSFEDRVRDYVVANERAELVRFRWRAVQEAYWKARSTSPRRIVLKARRHGITTIELLDAYDRMKHVPNFRSIFLAQTEEASLTIFEAVRTFFDNDGSPPHLRREPSRKSFRTIFGSTLMVGTASSRALGRGATLQKTHGSEVAYWEAPGMKLEGLLAALLEATSHGDVTLESTANGFDAVFHPLWREAESRGFLRVFLPWHSNPSYRLEVEDVEALLDTLTEEERALADRFDLDGEQVAWMRARRRSLGVLFPQEYPSEPEEAFITSGSGLYTAHDAGNDMRRRILAAKPPVETSGTFERGGEALFVAGPVPGVTYYIGADSAEGHADGDFSAWSMRDSRGALIGVGQHRESCFDFASRLVRLARRFNDAVIVPESNSPGPAVIEAITKRENYRNVFREMRWNGQEWQPSAVLGWRTSSTTRDIMIQQHLERWMDPEADFGSTWLLSQMATIHRSASGKWEGVEHDDLWMADMIATMAVTMHLETAPRRTRLSTIAIG